MNASDLTKITALRARLHDCPELSGRETATLAAIADFLSRHTTLRLERRYGWLLATHWEADGLPGIGFRAETDAIPAGDPPEAAGTGGGDCHGGDARHGCGHDGHCAILCGVALALEGRRFGKNVRLIFQGAEETGEGARHICDTWPGLRALRRIYALHNIPGHPLGALLVREGCFACASEGLIVRVSGRPAHAAYPEDGANPAALLSRLVLAIPEMIREILCGAPRMLMHTVIGLQLGGENFGLSASEGRLCLTLRAHRQADIDALAGAIRRRAEAEGREAGMTCAFETRDVFPDTDNRPACVAEAAALWRSAGLSAIPLAEPMRWSEDFGWFLKAVPGMYFGVGAGEACPGLHTAEYRFNDAIIPPAVDALLALLG